MCLGFFDVIGVDADCQIVMGCEEVGKGGGLQTIQVHSSVPWI